MTSVKELTMKIPRQVRVGKRVYKVVAPPHTGAKLGVGRIDFEEKVISVATRSPITGRRLRMKDRTRIFWHEIVHAVLMDMGSRKNSDEGFVEAFAIRLTDVVTSARF